MVLRCAGDIYRARRTQSHECILVYGEFAVASLILSLESVFSVLAGWVLMPGSSLTRWEIVGCIIVFAAVILVNITPAGEPALPEQEDA